MSGSGLLSSNSKLTQDQTKLHNRRLVLRVIYEASWPSTGAGPKVDGSLSGISRADIARATGLTRTTISAAVAELIEEGLVGEAGRGPSAGGKRPRLLNVVADARYAIGVDVAGYGVQGCVYDLRGRAVHSARLPIPPTNGVIAVDLVYQLIDGLISLADRPLLGVGLGVPGLLDAQEGIIHQAVNLGWHELPLRRLLQERYDLPVYLVNDSQAAALAQYTFANGREVDDLAAVLVERGISAGLVIRGRPYYGGGYSGASEIGHLQVVDAGLRCACGRYGCLETVASQEAVVRQARQLYEQQPGSVLRSLIADPEAVDMSAILQAYRAGDAALAALTTQVGHYLGIAIANLVTVANLPLVVLAGSVARLGDGLLAAIDAELTQRLLPPLANHTDVKVSELGDEIVMLGAAALLLANELGMV